MKTRTIVGGVLLLILTGTAPAFTQAAPQPREPYKYRVILSAAGAGGGFALGVCAGLAAFDDAPYANRKVWTAALVSAAAGAVGGYFIGRAVDKSAGKTSVPPNAAPWRADSLERSLARARLRLLAGQGASDGVFRAGTRSAAGTVDIRMNGGGAIW